LLNITSEEKNEIAFEMAASNIPFRTRRYAAEVGMDLADLARAKSW